MLARTARADPLRALPDVNPARIPRHIAIIMDGNGRWARQRGFPRLFGHRNGARAVRETVEECGRLGVEALTLYSFSLENWKRPRHEIDALMELCVMYLDGERQALVNEGIRFRVIGRRDGLPQPVLSAIESVERATRSATGPILCLAINYSARAELVDACRALARRAATGDLDPGSIDEQLLAANLYTADFGDLAEPDLLIRTAGEQRISNFLLWQISYAELFITDIYWPDFTRETLHHAIRDYAARTRRFGAVDGAESDAP